MTTATRPLATRSSEMSPAQQLHILLVEDDEIDVMNVQRALKKNNATCHLHRAANGIEALAMLRSDSSIAPGSGKKLLILLDLNMPKMGGIEFLKELRADSNSQQLPVVVLTTSKQSSDLANAFKYHVSGYLVKPIDFHSFVETIDVLSRYWSMSEMP